MLLEQQRTSLSTASVFRHRHESQDHLLHEYTHITLRWVAASLRKRAMSFEFFEFSEATEPVRVRTLHREKNTAPTAKLSKSRTRACRADWESYFGSRQLEEYNWQWADM
jgi:hypothetical protein